MTEQQRSAKEVHEEESARCVERSVPNVTLQTMSDAPDAHLWHADGFWIGLEIVRIEDERPLHLRKRFHAASELIKTALEQAKVTGVYWVTFDLQEMFDDDRKRAWDKRMPTLIAQYFKSHGPVTVDAAELRAATIERIARIDAMPADHCFVGWGWRTVTTQGNTLADMRLAEKNERLASYRQRHGDYFREYWLAISSLGPGSLDNGFFMLLGRKFDTSYDRVFLLMHAENSRLEGVREVTPLASL
ncbi:MAG TPA: hypothetical protein VN253_12605 [Kofleriaceae bacterium]|nr:hypothetical protein [Kofleriaceae bacterium]